MDALRRFADSYPVTAYVLLCFLITWTVWFSIPTFAGDDWTLIKIFVGIGMGPGLAAVLLDRLRRGWNENDFTRSWWMAFSVVAGRRAGAPRQPTRAPSSQTRLRRLDQGLRESGVADWSGRPPVGRPNEEGTS